MLQCSNFLQTAQSTEFTHFLCKCRSSFHIIVVEVTLWYGSCDQMFLASSCYFPQSSLGSSAFLAPDLCVITVLGVICQVQHLSSRSRNLHSGVPQTFILKGNVSLSYWKKMRDKLTVRFSKEIVQKSGLSRRSP